jgi:hypothetical protein
MCENSPSNLSDLGPQEPRGCRYVFGDPGVNDWHYCQAPLPSKARLGDVLNPPYCATHTKLLLLPQKPYQWKWRNKYDNMVGAPIGPDSNIVTAIPGNGDGPRLPVDLLIKLGNKGLSHD